MASKQRDGSGAAGKEKKVTFPSTSVHKDDRSQKSSSRPSSSSGIPTKDLAASSSSPSSQPRTKASPSYLKPTFSSLLHEPVKQGVKKLHGSEESAAEKLMRRRSFDGKPPSSSRGQKPLLSSSASFSPKSSRLTGSPSADKIASKLIKPVKSQTPSLSTKSNKKPTSTSTNLIPKRDSKASPTTNYDAKKALPVSEEIADPPNAEAVLADTKLSTVVAKDDPPKTEIPAIEPVPVVTDDPPKTVIPAVEQVSEISTEQEVKADDVMITSPKQHEEEGSEKMGTQDIPVVSDDHKNEPTLAPIITKTGEEDHQKDEETNNTKETPEKDESEQRTSDTSQGVEMETEASVEDGETDLNATFDNKGKEEEKKTQYNSNEEVTKAEEVTPKEENPFKAGAMNSIQKRQAGGTSNQDKKITSPVSNNVIEETTSKLMERRNRVRAMAGAFETVISLQQPDNH